MATSRLWKCSVNAKGFVLRHAPKSEPFLPMLFLLRVSPESIPCSVEPGVPFAPNHNSIPGQISTDFFQQDRHASSPFRASGLWSTRGATISWLIPSPLTSVARRPSPTPPGSCFYHPWCQTWYSSCKVAFICSPEASYGAHKGCSLQRSVLCGS
jgi:hypothetical protein